MSHFPASPTPPSAGRFVSGHRQFPHSVQFYLDEAFLLRMISELVLNALKAGDRSLIIATAQHHEGLLKRLIERGVDIRAQRDNGYYTPVDADKILTQCTKHGELDLVCLNRLLEDTIRNATKSAKEQQPHLFIFGELVALLCAQDKFETALALEQAWEKLSQHFSFSLLCGYPIKQFESTGQEKLFLRICGSHSTVIPPDAYTSFGSEKRLLQALAREV
jgi:hypothetical protein